MWLTDGEYDYHKHHNSYLSVGVPGTVTGLHSAWQDGGTLPWASLVDPAVRLARYGFELSGTLARSLERALVRMERYPASMAQFSKWGSPFQAGKRLVQPDLARTLSRIAEQGPAGFYKGETAELIEKDMTANGGLVTGVDANGDGRTGWQEGEGGLQQAARFLLPHPHGEIETHARQHAVRVVVVLLDPVKPHRSF